jgi:hypothetical protein
MKIKSISAAVLLTASVCLADANVQQKNQVHFGGLLGGVVNLFARDAGQPINSSSIVKGDRKLIRTGNVGEIIDLAEEKVYHLDFDRKTYTVKTFADLRREYQDQQQRARKSSERQANTKKNEGPEYEVDFDVKRTGKEETMNGWKTRQEIVTIAVHEKGKKIEESGGFMLTSDMWMGPKIAAYQEIANFDRRFVEKVYGSAFSTAAGQFAAAMAMSPAFGKAMKAYNEKQGDFDGTPIRTKMTFETVAGANQNQQQSQPAETDASTPSSVQGAVIGGLFNKMKQKRQQQQAESGQSPNRSTLFDSNSELIKATTSASAAEVAVPSDFRQR